MNDRFEKIWNAHQVVKEAEKAVETDKGIRAAERLSSAQAWYETLTNELTIPEAEEYGDWMRARLADLHDSD